MNWASVCLMLYVLGIPAHLRIAQQYDARHPEARNRRSTGMVFVLAWPVVGMILLAKAAVDELKA